MKKETVTMFNLEAAFKALDEIETPEASGGRFKANRVNLKEYFNAKTAHEVLVEDYFDVNDTDDLNAAKEEREAEIAKAKLARIEKIVDLDAETEEDILPSYVGKVIIQCPQCMTLFYKNEEDIEKSEETPEVVNINEVCQHCGNVSGYSLVGKVGGINEEEAENFDLDEIEIDENELNLDFPEEGTEEVDAEGTGEAGDAMEDESEDLDLDFDFEDDVEADEDEEENEEEDVEETNESLHTSELLAEIEDENDLKTDIESEHVTLNEGVQLGKDETIVAGDEKDCLCRKKLDFGEYAGHIVYPAYKNGVHQGTIEFEEDPKTPHDAEAIDRWKKKEFSESLVIEAINEDLADWYRKTFDRPASISTQQAWEDELNGEMGEISDNRRKHLERKFAQQRDWEERHPDKVPPCPVITPNTPAEKAAEVEEIEEPIAVGESVQESEIPVEAEKNSDLKPEENVEGEGDILTEDATDELYDKLWSQPQPTDAETEANLAAMSEAATSTEDFDELDDAFDDHITGYLKEVYSNIESYTSTSCTMRGTKLVVEGLIKFQSGKAKTTRFTFDSNKRINNTLVFRGMNEGLTSEKSAFRLACRTTDKKLITENLSYAYTINGACVKGNTKK